MSERLLKDLSTIVVKQGVSLGGLAPRQQRQALALAWAALPSEATDEPGINLALKAALTGPAACLDIDHVELRRWLVDAGWLERDGYGRSYRRTAPEALPEAERELAAALGAIDVAAWVEAARVADEARRRARRAAWQASQAGTPAR